MKRWMKVTVAGLASLAPVAGFAAIDNTHHDMPYMSIGSGGEKCAYCHSKTNVTTGVTAYGEVGGFCVVVCHQSGTQAATGKIETIPQGPGSFDSTLAVPARPGRAATTVAFIGGSHGNVAGNIALATVGDTTASMTATAWPHATETNIQCTTCHAVHDNTNPPFLNAPLSSGTPGTDFCSRCHNGLGMGAGRAGRYDSLLATAGAHPTEMLYAPAAALARNVAKTTDTSVTMRNRTLLANPAANLDVLANITNNMNDPASFWETGGHLMPAGANQIPAASGNVGCYTCHSAHQAATAVTSSAGATSLILGLDMQNFCYGCHGGGAATPPQTGTTKENPGNTNEYHPVNTEAKIGVFPIPMSTNATLPTGGNYATVQGLYSNSFAPATGSPFCVSCHDVHGGRDGKMALRVINTTIQITNSDSICITCHVQSTTNTHSANSNWHHPGTNINYNNAANGGFVTTTGWLTTDGLGDLTDGLSCPDCHVANGTAHNW